LHAGEVPRIRSSFCQRIWRIDEGPKQDQAEETLKPSYQFLGTSPATASLTPATLL
jgi:hypothetical protein